MTEPVFVANLFLGLLGLALCLWHAWGTRKQVALLVTVTVYGIILEQLVILRFERYVYTLSDFVLTLGDVPVVIGFGWGAIIYSGMAAGEMLGLSRRVRPLFVGLYALHIDLAIDAIAIRIPFWQWLPPGEWFGVPLGNFTGWFLVATLFPAGWLVLERRLPSGSISVAALGGGSLLVALVGLIVGLEAWEVVARTLVLEILTLGSVLVLSLLAVIRDGIEIDHVDLRIAAVPVLYHGFYLGYYLALGMYRTTPALLGISVAMIAVTVFVHAGSVPWLRRRGESVGR
ncbi:carotenoid biosynthesis protein [Halobacteriaceae archaeon SHR40]|uniref:carotenoid biosynthesis protein n=1 Tax=Halovenus amylolytica TaxID=2500550 RepID=UPI000FE3EE81